MHVDSRFFLQGQRELWSRERGLSKTSVAYPPSFYMHLKDPSAHWEMIEGLESRFPCGNRDESRFSPDFQRE